jgi:outer membrane immunogenic protein
MRHLSVALRLSVAFRLSVALAAVTAFVGIGGAAFAADMPLKAPAYAPVYNWTGLYIGGTVGGAWGSFDPQTSTVFSKPGYFDPPSVPAVNSVGAQSIKPSSFTGGFEAGYNLQSGHFVYGIEGDIESFHLSGAATSGGVYSCCAPQSFTVMSNANTAWLATVRGRLGYTVNNWLFFVTGGAAFTDLHGNFGFSDSFGATESALLSNTQTGYTVGGGVEAGLWGNWSVKAEYLYVNFDTLSTTSRNLQLPEGPGIGVAFPGNAFTHSVDLKANIARAALNYRF